MLSVKRCGGEKFAVGCLPCEYRLLMCYKIERSSEPFTFLKLAFQQTCCAICMKPSLRINLHEVPFSAAEKIREKPEKKTSPPRFNPNAPQTRNVPSSQRSEVRFLLTVHNVPHIFIFPLAVCMVEGFNPWSPEHPPAHPAESTHVIYRSTRARPISAIEEPFLRCVDLLFSSNPPR